MRFLLVVLLVALMPLRSWAGDAMAIRMAGGGHTPVVLVASAHEECPGHHGPATSQPGNVAGVAATSGHADSGSVANAAQDHCANCASCQACFTVALTSLPAVIAPLTAHNSPPHAGLKSFTSADIALGRKPPIS